MVAFTVEADTVALLPELVVAADFDCFFEDILTICSTRLFLILYSQSLVLVLNIPEFFVLVLNAQSESLK